MTFRSRLHCFFLALALASLAITGACAGTDTPDDDEIAEARQAFRRELLDDAKRVSRYLSDTKAGNNISEMSLGWLAYSLLSEIAEQDPDLEAYFHQGNRDMASYLKHVFASNPEGEVNAMTALAQSGKPTYRLIARDMLQALRFIPDSKDPPDIQAKDRDTLAAALSSLKGNLERASGELL